MTEIERLKDLIKDKTDEDIVQLIIHYLKVNLYSRNPEAKTNSWDAVKSIRDFLYKDTDDFDWKYSVEGQWKEIEKYNTYKGTKLVDRKDHDDKYTTPIDAFLRCMEDGFYPPPELLLAISDSFNIYMLGKGKISLETVFFGQAKKRAGNYAARINLDSLYMKFYRDIQVSNMFNGKMSMTKFAENYFTNKYFCTLGGYIKGSTNPDLDEAIEIDNFLRGYRRWKSKFKADIKPS